MNLDVVLFAIGLACLVIAAFLGGMFILHFKDKPAGLQFSDPDDEESGAPDA